MEEENKVHVCRLCFKLISDNKYFFIRDSLKDMLQVITTDLNLDVTAAPMMCNECSTSLQEIFNFKTYYFEAEEKIESKIGNKKVKLNLTEIMNKSTNGRPKRKTVKIKLKKYKLCRTCLCTINRNDFTFLSKNVNASFSAMLKSCLPELDLSLISDPVMCKSCYKSLKRMKNFKLMCRENENKIKIFKRNVGINSCTKVDLFSVLQFSLNSDVLQSTTKLVKEECYNNDSVKIISERLDLGNKQMAIKDCLECVAVKMEPINEEEDCNKKSIDAQNCLQNVMVKMETEIEESRPELTNVQFNGEQMELKNFGYQKSTKVGTKNKLNICKKKTKITGKDKGNNITYCANCDFTTKYKFNLRRHLIVAHKRTDLEFKRKIYNCSECNFSAKQNIDLTRHMLSHVKSEALECTRCSYSTNQNSQLIKHILSHVNKGNMDKYSFLQLTKKK